MPSIGDIGQKIVPTREKTSPVSVFEPPVYYSTAALAAPDGVSFCTWACLGNSIALSVPYR